MTLNERLQKYLGTDFSADERRHYYDFIENFISNYVGRGTKTPDTDKVVAAFAEEITGLDKSSFIFLTLSSGYIPEFYTHDSSEETLYTKLMEVLVCEWAKRVGFVDSSIQKQKSSMEDVCIRLANSVIVCDAKSFRLGRSQGAPNVKDTIKKADYLKWQENYRDVFYEGNVRYSTIGGVITFPSLHRWKGESDAYLYCTDKSDPIMLIYYEYMAFMLIANVSHETIIHTLNNYSTLFPEPTRNQHLYFEQITNSLFGNHAQSLVDYMKLTIEISEELVAHKLDLIVNGIEEGKKSITEEILNLNDTESLKQRLIEAEIRLFSGQFEKQVVNIKKFRIQSGKKRKDQKARSGSAEMFDDEGSED
jgi:hypothetical protein